MKKSDKLDIFLAEKEAALNVVAMEEVIFITREMEGTPDHTWSHL